MSSRAIFARDPDGRELFLGYTRRASPDVQGLLADVMPGMAAPRLRLYLSLLLRARRRSVPLQIVARNVPGGDRWAHRLLHNRFLRAGQPFIDSPEPCDV